MRDQMLTQLRFISHVLIGGAIGLLYMDIGDKGSMVQQNISLIFLVLLFLVSQKLHRRIEALSNFGLFHLLSILALFCFDANSINVSN